MGWVVSDYGVNEASINVSPRWDKYLFGFICDKLLTLCTCFYVYHSSTFLAVDSCTIFLSSSAQYWRSLSSPCQSVGGVLGGSLRIWWTVAVTSDACVQSGCSHWLPSTDCTKPGGAWKLSGSCCAPQHSIDNCCLAFLLALWCTHPRPSCRTTAAQDCPECCDRWGIGHLAERWSQAK